MQNAFYDFVSTECLEHNCLLLNTCKLIWSIFVRKEIPQQIKDMKLNRETLFNYLHLTEKLKFYLPNIANKDIIEWKTFNFIMQELYKRIKKRWTKGCGGCGGCGGYGGVDGDWQ